MLNLNQGQETSLENPLTNLSDSELVVLVECLTEDIYEKSQEVKALEKALKLTDDRSSFKTLESYEVMEFNVSIYNRNELVKDDIKSLEKVLVLIDEAREFHKS